MEYYKEQYKRFLVFEIIQYYPSGGLYDCEESFDTLEEAENYMKDRIETRHHGDLALFDRIEGKYVKTKYER